MHSRTWLAFLLVGCSGDEAVDDAPSSTGPAATTPPAPTTPATTTPVAPTDSAPPTNPYVDYGAIGPAQVTSSPGTLSLSGCELDYVEYLPDGNASGPLVVLGHGFQRRARHVAGLASHVASHGVRVVTPDYCHSTVFDSDPAANGLDAAALAAALAPGEATVHIGHSAGGLAALFAASSDPAAVAVLGLDPVTTTDEAADEALAAQTAALWALFGEPSSCNADANLLEPLREAGAMLSALPSANHCDFESPTDGLCTTFCGDPTGVTPLIAALTTAWAAHHLGTDDAAAAWLPSGSRYEELAALGYLVSP